MRAKRTVLPDRLILIGQKLVESAKNEKFKYIKIDGKYLIENFKCDFLDDFQTLWARIFFILEIEEGSLKTIRKTLVVYLF